MSATSGAVPVSDRSGGVGRATAAPRAGAGRPVHRHRLPSGDPRRLEELGCGVLPLDVEAGAAGVVVNADGVGRAVTAAQPRGRYRVVLARRFVRPGVARG